MLIAGVNYELIQKKTQYEGYNQKDREEKISKQNAKISDENSKVIKWQKLK